jgi:single-stranded-DNA-specific exonuclease
LKTWLDPELVEVPPDLRATVGGHPLAAEILVRRGIRDPGLARGFLDPAHYSPAQPYQLSGMQLGVERLWRALQKGEKICVWGDFDVDGQTATTALVSGLRSLGGQVNYHIPLREKESHGVNLPALRRIIDDGLDLLLTCDTGIGDHPAVAYANERGVEVIITDHHDPPQTLPEALAVINPKLDPADGPLISLPGVGVAYKLLEALFERSGRTGEEAQYLDLVALGIVADLALQIRDARYLLQRGLEALRGTSRLGLRTMMELAEVDPQGLTEEHIGFELGPRLNALGRLADANSAVELLTTDDPGRARLLATRLEGLNAERKLITGQVFQAAQAQLQGNPELLEQAALVLSHSTWPGGVIGIVASRLVERYARPVALIASPPGELARGSARSIPGVNITAAIATHQDMLSNFGGHPMAAGFSLPEERIPEFRRALADTVAEMIAEARLEITLPIDAYYPLSDLSLEVITDLERLAPFGPGNPSLVLVSEGLKYENHRTLGRTGEHIQLSLVDEGGDAYKVIWWGGGIESLPEWLTRGEAFDLAYSARSRDFRGQKELQIEWLEARPVDISVIEVGSAVPTILVEDHRQEKHPLVVLKKLLEVEDVLVWAEAGAREKLKQAGVASVDRNDLVPNNALAIWTTPPDGDVLRTALEVVSPDIVHLFAVDPAMDRMEAFLERLAGLVKFALQRNEGRMRISVLAGATAQTDVVVRAGLEWMAGRGIVNLSSMEDDEIQLAAGDQAEGEDLALKTEELKDLLAETTAYRAYFARVEAKQLLYPDPDK